MGVRVMVRVMGGLERRVFCYLEGKILVRLLLRDAR